MQCTQALVVVMALALGTADARAAGPDAPTNRPAAAERLAPTREDLRASTARLRAHVEAGEAIGAALTALQLRWTARTPDRDAPCVGIEAGWRLERFGASLREVTQAARVEARTLTALRGAATVAPLVAASERADGDALLARTASLERTLATAGAWQAAFVRPSLAACPASLPGTPDAVVSPVPLAPSRARDDAPARTALLALGDGWACGADGPTRAGDAVIVLEGALACWAPTPDCACVPQAVGPGGVIGPLGAGATRDVAGTTAP